jgi:hypothetical protein
LSVLAAIGELSESHPPSNREIAAVTAVTDEGQMSKLLKRLEGLGLVENTGVGHAKGMANEWGLTARGVMVRLELERRFGVGM